MKTVQPIRDKKKIAIMKTLLREKGDKYYILFRIGINVGLRVSDILLLKVSDVRAKTHVTIVEKKTGKVRRFLIPNSLQKEIAEFIKTYNMEDEEYSACYVKSAYIEIESNNYQLLKWNKEQENSETNISEMTNNDKVTNIGQLFGELFWYGKVLYTNG